MSELLYANNASTTLAVGINAAVTSITLATGTGALFPVLGTGQYFVGTLVDAATGLLHEVVYVTALVGDVATVIRGREGTAARSWLIGDQFANFWTAGQPTGFWQGQAYAGDPNMNLAGSAGTAGGVNGRVPSMVWDTANQIFWICTTTGSPTAAVWTPFQGSTLNGVYWCGTSTGSANAQTITAPGSVTEIVEGLCLSFLVGGGLTNTGATTLTVTGLGTDNIYRGNISGPMPLLGGELDAGNIITVRFDGTQFQIDGVLSLGPNALYWCGTSTGSANAQVVTTPGAMQALPTGQNFDFSPGFTNSGAATITVGSFGTFSLRRLGTAGPAALTGGELVAGVVAFCSFDGTYVQIMNSALSLGTNGVYWCGTSTGTANAQTIAPPSLLVSIATGVSIAFKAGAALTNTTALTLTVTALGTFNVYKSSVTGPVALTGAEVQAGNVITARYDGTRFQLVSTPLDASQLYGVSSISGLSGTPAGPMIVDIANLPAKATPVSADLLMLADSQASFALKASTMNEIATQFSESDFINSEFLFYGMM